MFTRVKTDACGTNSWGLQDGSFGLIGANTVDCTSEPSQSNYVFGSGTLNSGSTRTVTCGTGFTGSPSSIWCDADSGTWSTASGCTPVCSEPSQSSYVFASGDVTEGSTRTVSCDTGFSGTPSSVTCEDDGSGSLFWSTASGCADTDGCSGIDCGSGSCVDEVAPSTGYTCSCNAGYYDNGGSCSGKPII